MTVTTLADSFSLKHLKHRRGYDAVVFSGGGVRGIAQLGCIHYIQKHRPELLARTHVYAGSSVGSIMATSLAMGLDAKDVLDMVIIPWKFKKDVHIRNLTSSFGLDSGKGLEDFIASLVPEDTTFQSIREENGAILSITGTNLNTTSVEVFDVFSTPDMPIRTALRISCAVPMLFTAVEYGGCLYSDGGVAENFPYRLTTERYGCKRTLGITFHREMNPQRHAWTFENFLSAIVESAVNAPYVSYPDDIDVVELHTIGVSPLNFDITADEKRMLFDSGLNQIDSYLKKRV